ncbi:MAG: MerR family transcriptional regulator [Actinomycetota bacterium]|nr:MerR family transcriptional regulator [Actinomycetota bacterium]
MASFTISQVAERSGFPASTLRYYEQHGLLEPAGRTDAGYRLYDDRSLQRLGFIARAKQLGCSLEEIADLVELWDSDECEPVQARLHALVTTKIADARTRSAELVRLTAQLQTAAARLGGAPIDGPCDEGCACMSAGCGCRSDGGDADDVRPTGVPLGTTGDPAITCTLSADEIPDRAADWGRFLDHVRHRSRTDDGGLRLELVPAAPIDELTRLVVAEQACCTFFAFTITVDHRGVALEVRTPSDAAELVDAVFGVPA